MEKNDRTEMYGTEREETQMERTEQYPGYNHRVQYYETDQMGCVHHSNYIRWFEESRSDYLAYLGMDYDKMEAAGVISPVLTVEAAYHSMTRYGEEVSIEVTVKKYNGVKIFLGYQILDKKDCTLRCSGQTSHCFLNREGKPLSLKKEKPEWHELLKREWERAQEQNG